MSAAVDSRFADRRHQVREAWARRRLRWVVGAAAVVLFGAVAYAALDSPWLAVRRVDVSGAYRAPVADVLSEVGVAQGTPMIRVRAGAVEAALESEPWVADAEVSVEWPGTVTVVVTERVPGAWVDNGRRWVLVAIDGTALETGSPGERARRVDGVVAGLRPGARLADDTGVAAVVAFLGLLPPELSAGSRGAVTARGGVVTLGDITILIGDGTDLEEKAAAATALLERGVRPGSAVSVVSPTRPAVSAG